MAKLITRTFVTYTVHANVYDKVNKTVNVAEIKITNKAQAKNEQILEKYLKREDIRVLAIESVEENLPITYGMDETEFLKYAHIVKRPPSQQKKAVSVEENSND